MKNIHYSFRNLILAGIAIILPIMAISSLASDHADPIFNKSNELDLTGLFVFPDQDSIVVILTLYAGLNSPPPYKLEGLTYTLFIDSQSAVTFKSEEDRLRYGGTVVTPEKISATATITVQLKNDASLAKLSLKGFPSSPAIETWTGLRDDPFIFPKFFGTNVIAIAAKIPRNALPKNNGTFLAWATSSEKRRGKLKQIDHVGRGARTQNPRLDFLNTLPPSKHVAVIKNRHDHPNLISKELMKHIQPLFAIRHYDFFPDVLIYSDKFKAIYPNGRKLPDDIAALSCITGDCMLWELSFADSDSWPRTTKNDKPFLNKMPYLAAPWP